MTDLIDVKDEPSADASPHPPRRPSLAVAVVLIAIALLAIVQAAVSGVHEHRPRLFDERRFELWATNLKDHGFYGDLPTQWTATEEMRTVGYSAYVPPGYPFFLIALRSMGGSSSAPIRTAQAILVGLAVFAAGYTALLLFGPIAGVLTEVLLVGGGALATYAEFTLSETLAAATLIGSIALLTLGLQRKSKMVLACSGVLLGYSALVRPQVWLLPIPIALFIVLAYGRRRQAAIMGLVFLIASIGTIAPWTIRNELRLHAFVPVSTYTWINFWLVNNPEADGRFRQPQRYIGVKAVRAIRALPEVQQDNAWRHMALSWVRAHPGTAIKGWIRNERLFVSTPDSLIHQWYGITGWRPPRIDERYLLPFAILTILAAFFVPGLTRAAGPSTLTLIYFLAFFALFLPDPRFRLPLIPILAVLAAGLPETFGHVLERLRARRAEVAPA